MNKIIALTLTLFLFILCTNLYAQAEMEADKDVLFMLRDVYSKDPDALIASSQVIAIHYQTVAAANNYWRDENSNE